MFVGRYLWSSNPRQLDPTPPRNNRCAPATAMAAPSRAGTHQKVKARTHHDGRSQNERGRLTGDAMVAGVCMAATCAVGWVNSRRYFSC